MLIKQSGENYTLRILPESHLQFYRQVWSNWPWERGPLLYLFELIHDNCGPGWTIGATGKEKYKMRIAAKFM